MQDAIEKASALIEALPYIRSFHDKVVVVKYGGSAIEDDELHYVLLSVAFLSQVGIRPVLVHGGGKFITEEMKRQGVETRFVYGHRYTDERTLRVAEDVLVNRVNRKLVETVRKYGGKAVSLTSADSRCVYADRFVLGPEDGPTGHGESIGLVGRVTRADADRILAATEDHTVPVIAPLATGPSGETLNCNADTVAAVVAGDLSAEKFVLLTDVAGILLPDADGKPALVSSITESEAEREIRAGHISGGMLPKVKACFRALDAGVKKAHIVDGRVPYALLLEIFTRSGIGTEIVGRAEPQQNAK